MMDKKKIIQKYIDGWKESNKTKILGVLSDDCMIIESHGPTYSGKSVIAKWIEEWITENNQVDKWDLISFYEIDDNVIFEWIFECTVKGENHYLEGISLIKFRGNKIIFIREYRTTKKRFEYK